MKLLNYTKKHTDKVLFKRFQGCLVGLACGDYLGAPVEFFKNRKEVEHFFGGKELKISSKTDETNKRRIPGHYTDDTSMALCLAESLIKNGFNVKDQFLSYRQWLLEGLNTPYGDNAFGIGQHTFKMLTSLDENALPNEIDHQERHGGNGALMRCAPLGLMYFNDLAVLKEKTIKATIITHNNFDAVWSCVVLNSFIAYSLLCYNKSNFTGHFISRYPECPDNIKNILLVDYSALPKYYDFDNSGFVLNTLQIVLYSFFQSTNVRDSITAAVFMGGDTDTQGAITGALAGSYYGFDNIPTEWTKTLLNGEFIENIATRLYSKSI